MSGKVSQTGKVMRVCMVSTKVSAPVKIMLWTLETQIEINSCRVISLMEII